MKTICIPYVLIAIILLTNCSKDNSKDVADETEEPTPLEAYFPPTDSNTWETLSLDDLDWNSDAEQPLYDFLEENDTKAFIVLKDGRIVMEKYFGTHSQDTPWYWASAGKTLTAFTTGIALDEGYLSLNDKTSDYLGAGWTGLTTEKENLITIWHQLTMTSGMDDTEGDCKTTDCLTYIADAGTRWGYHNAPYTLYKTF